MISLESSHENPRNVVKGMVCMVVSFVSVCSQTPNIKTFPKKPANIYSSNQRRTIETKRSPNDRHPRVPGFN